MSYCVHHSHGDAGGGGGEQAGGREGGRRTGTGNMEEDWRGMQSVEGWMRCAGRTGEAGVRGRGWRKGRTEREARERRSDRPQGRVACKRVICLAMRLGMYQTVKERILWRCEVGKGDIKNKTK